MSERGDACEAFGTALLRDESDWGWAKAQAFAALRELDEGADGPGEGVVRRVLDGDLDDRIPLDWRPVFVETCHQWQGFRMGRHGPSERAARGGARSLRRLARAIALSLVVLSALTLLASRVPSWFGTEHPLPPLEASQAPPSRIAVDLPARIAAQATLSPTGSADDLATLLAGDDQLVLDFRAARRALLGHP